MKWFQNKNLSTNDMQFLQGSQLMEKLMSCKLVIAYEPKDSKATLESLGLHETKGLYHYRRLQETSRSDTVEIFFENPTDRDMVMENLVQLKMTQE